jgi:hypothetical protein
MFLKFPIFVGFILYLLFAFAISGSFAGDAVAPIQDAYEEGNFSQAEYLALKALQNIKTLNREETIEIHKLLAFCYVAMDDHHSAISEFMEVLQRNPRQTLDPLYVSPKIIEVFNEAKAQFRLKPATEDQSNTSERMCLNASLHSLLLPGLGQIKKEQPIRGYAFMAAQGITIGAWVGLIFYTNNQRDDYREQTSPSKIEDSYQNYKTALCWRNGMGLAALAVYIGSFLDTLYGPKPHITTSLSLNSSPTSTLCLTLTIPF